MGWICAVITEYVAAYELLDEEFPPLPNVSPHNSNAYTLSRINDYYIVVIYLPKSRYNIASAAIIAKDIFRFFESIRIGLIIGIAKKALNQKYNIRLKDVVIKYSAGRTGGVLPYKYKKKV